MSTTLLAGIALLLVAFSFIFRMSAKTLGWREAVKMWAATFGLTALVFTGIYLILASN